MLKFPLGKANGRAERTQAPILTEADRPAGSELGASGTRGHQIPISELAHADPAAGDLGTRAWQLHIGWSPIQPPRGHWIGTHRDAPRDHTKDPTPRPVCISCGSRGRLWRGGGGTVQATYVYPAARSSRTRSGGARGTPPRSPGPPPRSAPRGLPPRVRPRVTTGRAPFVCGPSTAAASLARPPGGPAPSWLASCICMSTGPAPPPPARACEARGGGGGSLLAAREPERSPGRAEPAPCGRRRRSSHVSAREAGPTMSHGHVRERRGRRL